MSYTVRFSLEAKDDIERLFAFLADEDIATATSALQNIQQAFTLVEEFPFSCRKAKGDDPFFRELLIQHGRSGYVALFEIEDDKSITVVAIRHQREDDYH
ncbi:MAG: type II toxin-antitoxin system RelE/ParE family toxin [Gammaproteobacteria bacterium]|nr:type II toxin-antitoxin system RelE/ParE family toxin [Gammaproteobacteria bacterium]